MCQTRVQRIIESGSFSHVIRSGSDTSLVQLHQPQCRDGNWQAVPPFLLPPSYLPPPFPNMADGTGDPVKPFLIPKSHSHPQSEEGDHQSSTVFFQREEFSWLPRYCRHLTSKRAGCQQKVRNGFTGREPDWTCRENHNIRYPHIVANQYMSVGIQWLTAWANEPS